jgi:hypothetical protein
MLIKQKRRAAMTINEVISLVDKYRPGNRFDNDLKTQWIYEVDSAIFDEYINPKALLRRKPPRLTDAIDPLNLGNRPHIRYKRHGLGPYRYETDGDENTILPDRFSDVYVQYIKAKMDAEDGETDEYNNSVVLYQSAMDEFSGWFIRNYGSSATQGFIF